MGLAYKAANIPPPSDPRFRKTLTDYYGRVGQLVPENAQRLQVGPMAATQLGGELYRRVRKIWEQDLRKEPFTADLGVCAVPVRVCLSSTGDVTTVCVDDSDACTNYGGLFTGCADPDGGGKYVEHPCGADRLTWQTFQWSDPPAVMSCRISAANPPLIWSLDVLETLWTAWRDGGGAAGAIDRVRTFVMATNTSNAVKAGLISEEYRNQAIALQAEADQISRGNNPTRAGVVAAASTVAAIATQAGGPYGAAVAAVALAVAAIASVWPVAVGIAADELGLPMNRSDLSASFLGSIIQVPNAAGQITLDIPPPPVGGSAGLAFAPTLRGAVPLPGTTRTASQAARILSLDPIQPTLTIVPPRRTSAGTVFGLPAPVAAAGAAAALWALSKR